MEQRIWNAEHQHSQHNTNHNSIEPFSTGSRMDWGLQKADFWENMISMMLFCVLIIGCEEEGRRVY
jgi:hypothetical protein